jgi:TolA-binding protein
MKIQIILILLLIFTTSCLQTRSESVGNSQSQIYRKKNVENQNTESEVIAPKIDERDELIRTLNGRVEALESRLDQAQKEKQATQSAINPDSQKIILLQEALSKMEMQIQKLEGEKPSTPLVKSSDANLKIKKDAVPSKISEKTVVTSKQTPFEIAEDHFQKKEWKKAILSYQSHVEQYPKGKSVPEAKYKIGVCFQELGLKDEASAFYEEVLSQYPKTEPGKKAKIRLASMSAKPGAKKAHN